MAEVLEGAATPAQIAAFCVALRINGETVEEMAGLLGTMLEYAVRVPLPPTLAVVDTWGAGVEYHAPCGSAAKPPRWGCDARSGSWAATNVASRLDATIDEAPHPL